MTGVTHVSCNACRVVVTPNKEDFLNRAGTLKEDIPNRADTHIR